MKKFLFLACAALVALTALVSCDKNKKNMVNFSVTLTCEDEPLVAEGINFIMTDENKTQFNFVSDATGKVQVSLPEGNYSWTANGKVVVEGVITTYSGASVLPCVVVAGMESYTADLTKVVTSSIIIKEAYIGGFTDGTTSKTGIDSYIALYNNTDKDVDASNVVFCFTAPYTGSGTNKYIVDGSLTYENEDWIPAYGAIWWFTNPVTIPAYSQIVVACFGAIDHTQTYAASVDLSKADYYWMSNEGISQYNNSKYTVSTNIPKAHYLTCYPFSTGTAWALAIQSPAIYIGKMTATEADALSKDTESYDHTLGTSAAFNVVKFPKERVLDVLDICEEAKESTRYVRFPAAIDAGYSLLTNKLGHTTYRNVDKAATEALPENEGKLVTTYDKTLDPSGIDAEASMKNGAHIIFMDTNNSTNDFHQRVAASIK